jgi:hypothetical protein
MGNRKDAIFDADECQRLHDYAKFLGPTLYVLRLREQDPEFNVRCHKADRCAWVRGDGTVVVAVDGHNPQERLR